MTINQNLRDLRQLSGMTQEEVANRVGLTRQAISSYESGRTQPDLDMLAKLAALYQTDISGILYGHSCERRKLRACKRTAAVTGAAVLLLVLIHSCLILFTNAFFPVSDGMAITETTKPLLDMRFAMIDARGVIQGLSRLATAAGCLILAVLLAQLKRLPSVKTGLLLALAFAAGLLACTAPFGAFDRVYQYADYLLITTGIYPFVVLLLLFWAILALVKGRRAA